jgi:tetratricopeptide (TPR) repeat protein
MFSRLFILALLVLVDLSVDAAPMLNSDQNRMEETRKEQEEALKTYRELAEKEPDTYLREVAQTLNDLGIVDSAQNRAEGARKAFAEALKVFSQLVFLKACEFLRNLTYYENGFRNSNLSESNS